MAQALSKEQVQTLDTLQTAVAAEQAASKQQKNGPSLGWEIKHDR